MTRPGIDADGVAITEAEHFVKCPGCGQWFNKGPPERDAPIQ
jgi:uncharacterized C2H2 Zn-finger protein